LHTTFPSGAAVIGDDTGVAAAVFGLSFAAARAISLQTNIRPAVKATSAIKTIIFFTATPPFYATQPIS
jgi:hypothetical protein